MKKDGFFLFICGTSLCLCALHIFQFIDSGFAFQPLWRAAFCLLFPVALLIFGKAAIPWGFWGYSHFLALQMTFQNYTAFLIVLIFSFMLPKMKIAALLIYAAETFIVATLHDKTPVHVLIHILNCAAFYYALNFFIKPAEKKLNLTNDEILILKELQEGKTQKEVELYSANTVCAKLKAARQRNGLRDNEELLAEFRKGKY